MSFLVDVMLGVSILGLILGLIFTSYQKCRDYTTAQESKRKVIIQLVTDHVITQEELARQYPAIKAKFDEIFAGARYKVSRSETRLSKETLTGKTDEVHYVATDIGCNIVEIDSLQKPIQGYLWAAISD